MLRNIQTQRGLEEAGSSGGMVVDDSMDSLAQGDIQGPGVARTFGRVTPVNLKFTP